MEKRTAQEHHSQITLVAFDGDVSMPGARVAYSQGLLAECPGFANAPELTRRSRCSPARRRRRTSPTWEKSSASGAAPSDYADGLSEWLR